MLDTWLSNNKVADEKEKDDKSPLSPAQNTFSPNKKKKYTHQIPQNHSKIHNHQWLNFFFFKKQDNSLLYTSNWRVIF